jgi:TM2 domain-containing membrane protein YozV
MAAGETTPSGEPARTLSPDQKYCLACAAVLDRRAEVCPRCGVRQAGTGGLATSPSGRSRIVAALFALLLGGFGAHKFYLGQPGMGVLYLLFCWTFIPALVALVEGIVLLTQSDEQFAAKYG